jgi:hypothetical protein
MIACMTLAIPTIRITRDSPIRLCNFHGQGSMSNAMVERGLDRGGPAQTITGKSGLSLRSPAGMSLLRFEWYYHAAKHWDVQSR